MVIEYKEVKTEVIDDEIILNEIEKYTTENDLSIETEEELEYTINDVLYDTILPKLSKNLELLNISFDIEKYRHLIDDSNYIENLRTCCDDYSNYNHCPICGTKLK